MYTAESRLGGHVAIPSISCELELAEVYDKVEGLKEPLANYR